jgi:hypothetical protein
MKQHFLFWASLSCLMLPCCGQQKPAGTDFADSFGEDTCVFSSMGRHTYYILEPGYQLTLEGKEGGRSTRLEITVLDETRMINKVETRVVEERESVENELIEISRNFFAICRQTGSIFYFGEEVDIYKNGKLVDHEGAWIAGGRNKAGIIMPGTVLDGSGYYQEIAPGVAMDRAEIVSRVETLKTAAGSFSNCLKTEETTPLHPGEREFKVYAPGIGLVRDGNLVLVKYGYIN